MAVFTKALCLFIFTSSAQAEEFLAARISSEEVQQQLHNELRTLLGHGDADSVARLERLQADIEPLFSAMPKNLDGGLDSGVARYALHRFFAHKHGWHVRGLEAGGAEKGNDIASTEMLEEHIPGYVLQLFEQQNGNMTGLRELAVLAATLEDVVHSEAIKLLSKAYAAQDHSVDDVVSGAEGHRIIETYLLHYLMANPELDDLNKDGLDFMIDRAPGFYAGWVDTISWAQDVRDSMDYGEASWQNPFVARETKSLASKPRSFDFSVRLVERLGEGFGQYQNLECRGLKNSLLDLSDGSGRVRLSKFYKAAFEKRVSQFSESPDYLRHLGVLDETDPRQPSVILTNYVYARSNCLASSGLYHVCCIDECEPLMAQLEGSIAHPLADPERVAELVTTMASETVAAPRSLSAPLRRRLDDIARHHGGSVPLHSRLFAQWMHHAYPNECRYPHLTGSLESPQAPVEWMQDKRLKASRGEMEAFMSAATHVNASETLGEVEELAPPIPWSDEEELVAAIHSARPSGKISSWLRVVVLLLPIGSVGAMLVRTLITVPMAVRSIDGKLAEKRSLQTV